MTRVFIEKAHMPEGLRFRASLDHLRLLYSLSSSLGLFVVGLALAGCDGGLAPPESNRTGAIRARIYFDGTWPPADSVRDARFVAMRFIPRDTSDFLELNRLAISDRLSYGAGAETVIVGDVRPGVFVYSGVAVNYAQSIFAWRPIAVYEENNGIFEVRPQDTIEIVIQVDFSRRPAFPPDR